ncbi:DgyrCDS12898 [Dimorphilus gyrociliatus]|nr:DgyrCDS12898 [Dimorphilus gyrociliatus]
MCIAWYALDVLFTSSSIIHLCMISIDRYLSLQYPLKYGRVGKSGTCRTGFEIFIVWILSFCIAVPLFFSSVYADHGDSDRQYKGCGPENASFVLSASISSFYAPLLIMIIMYLLTVRALQRQRRVQRSINANTFVKPDQKNHPLLDVRCRSNENSTTTLSLLQPELPQNQRPARISPSRRITYLDRSKRAVQVLGILFGVFVLFYLPFFATLVINATIKSVSDQLLMTFEWLAYGSAAVNPVVYHVFNPDFRRAFHKLFSRHGDEQIG